MLQLHHQALLEYPHLLLLQIPNPLFFDRQSVSEHMRSYAGGDKTKTQQSLQLQGVYKPQQMKGISDNKTKSNANVSNDFRSTRI